MSTETLHFKIGLSGTFHSKRPAYSVSISGKNYVSGSVEAASDEMFYVEFDAEFVEDQEYVLEIRLGNKESSDTIQDDDGNIVNDLLLNIKSIEIDDIDIGALIWSKSTFYPDKPQKFNGAVIQELTNCVNLGWNGTYTIKFTSPLYIWLLENI